MNKKNKEVSPRAYAALEAKVIDLREELKKSRGESRKLRKEVVRKDKSCALWKAKAKSRLSDYNLLKDSTMREARVPRYPYPLLLMQLGILLRISCGCSYGSITKILGVLADALGWKAGLKNQLPCAQTVQNWVRKVGYYQLQCTDLELKTKEVCVIVDESIRVGTEKLLLALVCPAFVGKEQALGYQDVKVLTLQGASSWKGDRVAQVIGSALQEKGLSARYFLSDEGNNLKCAAKLLGLVHVPDITHACSKCLEKVFAEQAGYKGFRSDVGKLQAKLAMGEDSCFRPPRQRPKARFMNQLPLVNWALCVNRKWRSLGRKARQKLAPVYQTYDGLLGDLSESIAVGKEISRLLKTKGINTETMGKARAELAKLSTTPSTESYQEHLGNYLDRYEEIRTQFPEDQSLHACSDVIESLFGKYKAHASDNFFVGVSSLSLEISLLTLSPEKLKAIIPVALEDTKMTALRNWKTSEHTESQAFKRMKFLKD